MKLGCAGGVQGVVMCWLGCCWEHTWWLCYWIQGIYEGTGIVKKNIGAVDVFKV